MEFKFTKEEEDIRRAANDFAKKALADKELEKMGHIPLNILTKMGDLGFLGLMVPEAYGGEPAGWVEVGIVAEEIAKGNIAMAYLIMLSCEVGSILVNHGSEKARKDWLQDLCSGKKLGCISVSEPICGSDLVAIKTRAIRDGDFYLLTGEKSPVSFGMNADFALVFANTDLDGGQNGITAFLVPLDSPGINRLCITNMGLFPSPSAEITLNEVKVPMLYRMGKEGEGFYINASLGLTSNFARVLSGLIPLGLAQHALNLAISYAKQRMAFGRPIAQFQAISGKIAENATLIEMGRWLCYRALWLKDQGLPHTKEAAMCSWWCPMSAYQVIEDALLIHGHSGYSDDHPFQQMLRDVIAFELVGGTKEMMKMIIAQKTIGNAVIPDMMARNKIC